MNLLREALAASQAGDALALATVIRTSGSAPRHVGAKMLIHENGRIINTIGGGRVELEVSRAGAEVAAGAPARRVVHHLVRDLAMCCGGSMELYLEPVAPSLPALRRALELWDARRPALLVTPLDGRPKQLDEPAAFGGRSPRLEGERFLEPVWPRDRLILFGGGHVTRAIGPLARSVGFEIVVCDDDETGALAEPLPWAHHSIPSFEPREVARALGGLGTGDYALILTRDHAIDERLLEKLLPRHELAYLGLIGSLGKIGRFRKRLEARGSFDAAAWERLHAPIGLDIAAETPAEIAVSVVAELIALRNRGRE